MCAATGRLPLSLLRRYFPAATGEHSQRFKLNILNAGLVFEGPLGLTAVPSKISSSLEGQVAVFCSTKSCLCDISVDLPATRALLRLLGDQ